jgi:hypothetical protein
MIPSSKRRLNQLWKRRTYLEAKVNLLIKRRLGRFREGTLSSEEFEKTTWPERNLQRVNEQIAKIKHAKSRNFYGSKTAQKSNQHTLNHPRMSIYRIFVAALRQ